MQQIFSMNVDAAKLMAAQNPAEKIEMIRKAWYSSGHTLENLSYQQRNYLGQLTELKGKDMDAALSAKNRGISYQALAKRTKEATKEGMSQKKVLKELSKGIKRLVEELGPKVTGFFDAFMQGFDRGVVMSGPFRKTLRTIHHGLLQMKLAGMEVGRVFVRTFPGVAGMLESISEMLHPKKFAAFRKELAPLFRILFKTQDFNKFFEALRKSFDKHFGMGKGGTFIKHIKSFMNAALKILGQGLAQMVKMWVQTFTMIGKLILNPKEVLKAMEAGGEAMKDGVSELVKPTIKMLGGKTGTQFVKTWGSVFRSAWDGIKKYFCKKWSDFVNWWTGPGMERFILGAGKMATAFFGKLAEMLMNPEFALPTAAFIAMFNPMLAVGVVRAVAGLFSTLFGRALPMGVGMMGAGGAGGARGAPGGGGGGMGAMGAMGMMGMMGMGE